MRKIIKKLASVRLAVVVILALAVLIATGTFVEAQYNADIASKMIYKTPWMFLVLGLLSLTLMAVMVDRWPWQRRHLPFILAHIGILFLLLGAVITMFYGVDGSLYFEIGKSNRFVQISKEEVSLWSTLDGDHFIPLIQENVDFYRKPPDSKNYTYSVATEKFQILEYWPFALAQSQVSSSEDPHRGAGLRFQMQNGRANVNEWLVQHTPEELATHEFGPAQVHLGPVPDEMKKGTSAKNSWKSRGLNELFVFPNSEKHSVREAPLQYVIFYADPARAPKTGRLSEGGSIDTGWMDFEFRILRYYPQAEEKWKMQKLEQPTPTSTSAIRVHFLDSEKEDHWIQLDDSLKFFTDKESYVVSYGHQRLDLGVELSLKDFQMGTYPGTSRAASYQSLVTVPDEKGVPEEHLISMNEPLKYRGYTFYQASFQNGPAGKPVASILSVNKDPGRFLKYLGSLIMSLGIVYLFYDRRKAASYAALKAGGKNV